VAESLVAAWARSVSPERRAAAARSPVANSRLVSQLASDASPEVRVAIAARKSLPEELLKALRKDSDPAVSASARENPNYQPGFFDRLLGG